MVYKRKFVFLLFFSFKNQSSQINLYVICQTQKIIQSKLKKKKNKQNKTKQNHITKYMIHNLILIRWHLNLITFISNKYHVSLFFFFNKCNNDN